jgi:hypothetical protein
MQALPTLAQKDLGDDHKTSFRALSEAPYPIKAQRLRELLKRLFAHRLHTSVYSPRGDPPHAVAVKQMR